MHHVFQRTVSKKPCPFFFLDKKEPKNGVCEKMAKNAALRLNRAKLASDSPVIVDTRAQTSPAFNTSATSFS